MKFILFSCLALLSFNSCNHSKKKKNSFNLFTIQQEKQLGAQVASEIDRNPTQYPVLDSNRYNEVYQYVYKIRNTILNSGAVKYKSDFLWRIKIINDDKTLNAFCTPGGYIYIYTGILKFMESEDELAGVLGHEIAHADLRHSTRQMTKIYGIQVLLEIITGNRTLIKDITRGIISLKFSRSHESEADEESVRYLCSTPYNASGGGGFFEKIQKANNTKPIEFLSTHPNPTNRIEHFQNSKVVFGCTGTNTYKTEYQQMLLKLPK
jgi:beta-barrel assembly-enhancing protease